MRRPSPETRDVDLGPGIPRMDLEPLDLPMSEVYLVVCVVCGGTGTYYELVPGLKPGDCKACGGSGQIGGGR